MVARSILLALLLSPFCACADIKLIGHVDQQTRDELLAYFHNGARLFAGGYIVDEFDPGLDKYIVSIENDHGNYIVTTRERPCKKTQFYLMKMCYRGDRCHWDLDHTYRCIRNKATSH